MRGKKLKPLKYGYTDEQKDFEGRRRKQSFIIATEET